MIFSTVTYIGVNQFSVSGNQLQYFHETERVRAYCGASDYSSISAVSYDGANTTVTLTQNILSDPISEVEVTGIWSGIDGNLPPHPHNDDDTGGSGVKGVSAQIFADSGAPSAGVGTVGDFYFDTSSGDYYKKTVSGWGSALANLTGPQGDAPSWVTGSGVPSGGTGDDGDMYLDTSSGEVYGPKTGGVWGAAVADITGPTGATGYSGVWLSGSGAPSGGTGNNGDMYLDTSTGDVYGPKAAGVWGAAVDNITGPPGIQGNPGESFALVGTWELS